MKLVIATLFISGVFSAPFSNLLDTPKSPKCDSGASRFHSKKSLSYEYEGETLSGVVGTSAIRSGLKLRAKCEISPVLPCVYMLKVIEAELLETQGMKTKPLVYKTSPGSLELRLELLARELYFRSDGGVISKIITDKGEPTHVLNIKRGILSAFQLKIIGKDDTINEVDVNGECKAKYHVKNRHRSGKAKTIIKTKNLTVCNDRSETNLGIPVAPYPTEKPFSFLSSNSVCTSVVSVENKLAKVYCEETHLFRPFSSGYQNASGAMTTVRQTLNFIGNSVVSHDGVSLSGKDETSLKYEHSQNLEKTTKSDLEVREILAKLVSEDSAKPNSARLFSKLIFAVRRLNTKAMKSIWRFYECGENGRCLKEQAEKYQKYIVDAFSHCGTLECAQFMVSTISDKKVGTQQSIAFLTGIALVGRPSENMVGNILYFCQETPSRTAFLTLGTLINKYCRQHNCDKLKERSSIYQADRFLQSKLNQNCKATSPEDVDLIVLALKAIGNAGRPLSAVTNLLKCAVEPGSIAINIEALQALRRISCSAEMTKGLFDIFKASTTDTEVRIETYLALMRCPSEIVIQKIADELDTEKNNQVGSFVWSHLTNALESTEPVYGVPLRDIISKALAGRELRSFNIDRLRYSHAYETSYYNKKHEVGGSSQAQVIFHPDSYFPRSAKFNLTVDVLGASINLLETAARFEGFESLIEQMFGSEGYFPDERLMNLLKVKQTSSGTNLREGRSIREEEMDEIKSSLEKLQDKMKIERKNPSGALSFKVFGHELQFLNFDDIDWLQGEADKINVIDTLINIARGGKYTFTKSFMFLEADHEVPTGLGLPLKLALNGSAVSSLSLQGKFDIRNMFWGKKKFDVRGYVTPSAVVDISGKMTVDAIHASSGIHVNSSLYTSTEINANATYKEGEGIKLSIDPPTKPIYIVNVTSNLATFLNRKFERLSGPSRRLEREACANLTNVVGVKLCGHISTPMAFRDYNAPYFPLTGQSSFGMTFQTTNADLARFEMEGRQVTSDDDNRYDWIFNVHIPGLTFGKRMEANCTFQFLKHGKYLDVSGGIHGYKFGKFEAMYNNDTNGLYTKFSTPELAYLKPITIESEVFNKTNTKTNEQKIGVSINATYKKFTIQEVITLFKQNNQYGFKSNLTYWPRMHIATEGRLSVVKKSVYLKMDDTNSKSKLFFAGKLGQKTNKFYVKIGNAIMNYEVKLDGEVNTKNKKLTMDMFTKPSRNLMKFEAYPRMTNTETGFYMRLLNVNTSLQFSGYLGASHTDTESSLKFNGIALNKPISIRVTHYNRERKVELVAHCFGHTANTSLEVVSKSGLLGLNYDASLNHRTVKSTIVLFRKLNEMGLNLNASLMDQTVDVFAAYFRKGQDTGLRLKLTGGDKTIDTVATYFTGNEEKGLKFMVQGMGHSGSLIWAYYNKKTEAGLSMKVSGLDKSMEIAAGVFTHDSEKGLSVRANVFDNEMEARWSILYGSSVRMKFAASAFKKNIQLKSFFLDEDRTKTWRIDAVYNGNMKSLISTYTGYPSRKTLCSELSDVSKVHFKICTEMIRGMGESALQLNAEGFGRKGEVRTSFVDNADEKGGRVQVKYNDVPLSDVFVGMVNSATYNGLRFKAIVYGKSMDALLKYSNTGLKRSVDLQLSVQGNLVSFESMWVREISLQGLQVNILHQNQVIGSAYALLSKKTGLKMLKIGAKSARKNGAEYKLSIGNSRIEKKLHSMFIVTANEKHYKYGLSSVYTNKGTSEQPNHMITSKLHYGHGKFLTSVAQMINTEHSFSLMSKEELFPGRFVTNKFAYSKLTGELFIQHELIPGIRMTYSGAFQRTSQLLGLRSTLTILDYPMNSSIILDKQSGRLRCTFAYSPTKPPVELTSHLQIKNKIDVGFLLSALNMTWDHKFLLDYSTKQMNLAFNVLPHVPVQMVAKMFDNNQFVFNLSTCSAFSVQLTGRPTTNEYQLIFRHQYLSNVFDDLKITTPSLQVLKKLQLKWDSLQVFKKLQIELNSEIATELRKVMDISMQDLFNKTVEITKKMAINSVNYMREDGRDFVKMAKNFSIELLKGDKLNNVIKKYLSHANETVQKLTETMMTMTDELRKYGSPLMETYKQLEKTLKEITSELSPHLKSLPSDIQQLLRRSFNRYKMVSICGKTIEGIIWVSLEKTRMGYKTVVQKCKTELTEFYRLMEKMKITAKEFTCYYDMKCMLENIQNMITKRVDHAEMKKMYELFKKISERAVGRYKTIETLVAMQLKNIKLQGKAEEFLRTIKKALNSMATILPVERINMLKKMSWQELDMFVRDRFKVHYKNLMQQVGPVTLKELQDKLKMLVENILKLVRDQEKQVLEKIRSLELREMTRRTRAAAAKIYEETADDLKKRGAILYPNLMNKLKDMLEEAKKMIKKYVELVKSRVAKLRQEQVERLWEAFEKVKRCMREAMSKYKNQLTLFADKRYQNMLNVVTSYKHMPIEDIFKNLDKLTKTMVNNATETIMEATLSAYKRASDYVQKMDFQNLKLLETKCKMIFGNTREILFKYKATTEKQLKPMLKKYLAEIEKIGDRILSYSKTRYNEMKLSYDKIKYMKFMEMYDKIKKMLEEWKKETEKCREICRAKLNKWKTKITKFIEEVKEESINVVSRVRKVNEEVQEDAIATFRPYKVLVKNTFNKHKTVISDRMAELPQHYPKMVDFVNKYRKAVDDYKSMVVQKLTNIGEKEVIDMVLESLNRCPFLAKFVDRGFVVKSQEFVKSSITKLRKLSGDYEVSIMKFTNDARDKMALRMEKIFKDLEYVGEANLYDIEVRVMEYSAKILAPAKSTYKKLSNILEKQLKLLAEKRNALKDLSNELFDKARVMVTDCKQLFKDMSTQATEWTTRKWANNKPLIDFIVRFSGKLRNDVEMYTYKMFGEEYYKELLKMTPNQLIQHTKQIQHKSYDLSRRLLETVKTTMVDRLRISLRALLRFIDEIDEIDPVNVLQQAKLKTEIGTRVIRSVLQDAGKQMRNISTEIIETILFLNRFYGIEETVYSRIPLKSVMVIRLNQVKEKVRDYLNANVRRDGDKIYTRVITMVNNMKDIGRRQYEEIVVLVKKLDEKYPNIAKYKNLTKLISDAMDCLREARVVLRGYITTNLEYCMKNKEIVMNTMRQMKVALDSDEYKLGLPKLDVIYKIGSNMEMCLKKQYAYAVQYVQYVKLIPMMPRIVCEMYKDTLRRLQHVAKTHWEKVKQDLTTFRQSSEKIWTPVRASLTKNLKAVYRMRRESMDVCTTLAVSYYNKGKDVFDTVRKINIRQVIANYTKTLSKETDVLVDNIKSKVSEIVRKIRALRKQAMDKNWRMNTTKDIVNFYESAKMNPHIIIEDLMNKTIELSEDFCNLSLIQDLLKFGRQCYSESNRVFGLTVESSEFALFVTKYVIQHSGIWDVARKLIDPFFWLPPSNSTAMIFGTPHVYTFDGKYFQFPGYKKPTCTYVLAHDFRDKNFTLLSREKLLILNTKSGHITIDANGKVEATVKKDAEGNDVKVVYNELPVEMMHVRVEREGSSIKIHHDQGLDVTCDLKHFFCTFNINWFYHGKLAGLLGTNNNELYDEFTKSDKSIAKTSIDFANSWEVSGDPECKVTELKKTRCDGSSRCNELFLKTTSPLARYFSKLNAEPFYQACLYDTSDCQTDTNSPTSTPSHCNVIAAYTALLREKGVWARQLPECASCGSKTMWQKWTQKGNKGVDVVLLVPETLNIQSHAVKLPMFLQELEMGFSGYKARYAVVGFGGKSGVHQHPHIVTGGGNVFGSIQEVGKAIQNMKFTNEKADALKAIEYLQRLPFNPGATKVVILLTDQNRKVNSTAPVTRAIKTLNMHGIIFNVIGPYFQKRQQRSVLGLWKDEAYLVKQKLQRKLHTIGLPSNDYTSLAESSQGGIFNLDAYSQSYGKLKNSLGKALKTTLIKQIDNDQIHCRQCVCVPSITEPVTFCTVNKHARC